MDTSVLRADCDSPGPAMRSASSSFGDVFGVFEDDDSDSEYLPPRLSFSADETAPFASQPRSIRGSPSGIQNENKYDMVCKQTTN